jgi:quinol monooxygenase YgiN
MADTSFYLIVHQTIDPGGLEEFKACCRLGSANAEATEPGTIGYQFYINEEGTESYLVEKYIDSEAFLKHIAAVQPILQRSMKVSTLTRAIVLGDPSPEAREALAMLGATYFSECIGFCR